MADFKRPTMLMILDGYGINPRKEGNAIAAAIVRVEPLSEERKAWIKG